MSYDGQTIFSAHNSPEMTPGAFAAMLDRVRAIREQDDARVRELCASGSNRRGASRQTTGARFLRRSCARAIRLRKILEALVRSGYAIFPTSALEEHRCGVIVQAQRVVYVPESWVPEQLRAALVAEGRRRCDARDRLSFKWPLPPVSDMDGKIRVRYSS